MGAYVCVYRFCSIENRGTIANDLSVNNHGCSFAEPRFLAFCVIENRYSNLPLFFELHSGKLFIICIRSHIEADTMSTSCVHLLDFLLCFRLQIRIC